MSSPIVLSCLITFGVPLFKLNTRKNGTIQATLGNLVNELSIASITGGTKSSLMEQNHNRVRVRLVQEVSRVVYCFP